MQTSSRIDSYDGKFVTFHYNRHEDNAFIKETITVNEFMSKLIRHIPDRDFKQIRYYGLYSKNSHSLNKYINIKVQIQLNKLNYWRFNILASFYYDPIKCKCCGKDMTPISIYTRTNLYALCNILKGPNTS